MNREGVSDFRVGISDFVRRSTLEVGRTTFSALAPEIAAARDAVPAKAASPPCPRPYGSPLHSWSRFASRRWACLLFCLLPPVCAWTADDPAAAFQRALDRRDFATARQIAGEQLAEHSDHPDWQLRHAEIAARQGRLPDAVAQAQKIARQSPTHRRSRIREAQWLSQLGRLSSATQAYQRCLDDFPNDPDALTGLGLTHLWQGDYHAANEKFAAALEKDPAAEAAFYGRVRLLAASGRAAAAWTEARQRDQQGGEQDPELGLLLATLARRVGAAEFADALASRATQDPDLQHRQRTLRAQVWIGAGQPLQGLRLIETNLAPDLTDYEALIETADACASADQRLAARALYEKAGGVTPERPEAHLGIARLASRDGRLAGSLAIYQQIVATNPESFEGWLGIIRSALLLEDATVARQALEQAHALCPRSALLHREQLRLALLEGDLPAFDRQLKQYLEAQPEDREARLWSLRRSAIDGPVPDLSASAWLDPLSPQLTAAAARVWLSQGLELPDLLTHAPPVPETALRQPAALALGVSLTSTLQVRASSASVGQAEPPLQNRIRCLAQGWWAYASTPLAHATELVDHFDSPALAVWLAHEMERRFRILYVETESPLWDDWLLLRAAWFHRWRNRWTSPEAAHALRASVQSLGQDWSSPLRLTQLEQSWHASEEPLPAAQTDYTLQITRARWRLYRRDFAGALDLFRHLAQQYPDASEPIERQSEVLRAAGRWQEADNSLRHLALSSDPSAGIRLTYADLLRRLGRPAEARAQLQSLALSQPIEPEFYLQQAALAEHLGQPETALHWCEQGLEKHPNSSTLLSWRADWLLHHRHRQSLARWLAGPQIPARLEPDWVAAASPFLPPDRLQALRSSAPWWFSWHWLAWERLTERSLTSLQQQADDVATAGAIASAATALQPALSARLPDSDLWLKAARLLDLAGRYDESEDAFTFAFHLGVGRLDADVLRLARHARRNPVGVAREFQRRLDESPDEPSLRLGFIQALLHAGQISAADRALAPLIEEDPQNPEVRMLAAQVRSATGQIRQARSLYESLLRQDPLAADPRAAFRALRQANELGVTLGYEYDARRDTSGANLDLADWQEGYLDLFWRWPTTQTFALGYHCYERDGNLDHQLPLEWSRALGRDWILRVRAAPGIDTDYIARSRAGTGASFRLHDRLFANLDLNYLLFADLDVWQLVPALTWRWHPRGTLEGRLYAGHNRLDSGSANESFTFAGNASWQLGEQSLVVARFAIGDENSANPTADLIGNDSFQSYGLDLRLGWRHRWTLTPAYRYEIHQRFDLHAASLSLGFSH